MGLVGTGFISLCGRLASPGMECYVITMRAQPPIGRARATGGYAHAKNLIHEDGDGERVRL